MLDSKSPQDQFIITQNFQRSPIPQSWKILLEAQYILLALLHSWYLQSLIQYALCHIQEILKPFIQYLLPSTLLK